ncbi:unnamed protein product [Paramecium octaurelia]|uniref:Uncharacterized protein n=1 Tax=Paramecium octaurelia TaxID=43137 RepID=A0A8S1W5H6_PAROT|nr:unnamed protein product [Paramecium octaurelia]
MKRNIYQILSIIIPYFLQYDNKDDDTNYIINKEQLIIAFSKILFYFGKLKNLIYSDDFLNLDPVKREEIFQLTVSCHLIKGKFLDCPFKT